MKIKMVAHSTPKEKGIILDRLAHFPKLKGNIFKRLNNYVMLYSFKYWSLYAKTVFLTIGKYIFTYCHFFEPRARYWTGLRVGRDMFDVITPIGQFAILRKGVAQ